MLRLDFAYARLSDSDNGPPIELLRQAGRQTSTAEPSLVRLHARAALG